MSIAIESFECSPKYVPMTQFANLWEDHRLKTRIENRAIFNLVSSYHLSLEDAVDWFAHWASERNVTFNSFWSADLTEEPRHENARWHHSRRVMMTVHFMEKEDLSNLESALMMAKLAGDVK